jgi:biofilm PGA synthesis N-glycosyltransferase PgaC
MIDKLIKNKYFTQGTFLVMMLVVGNFFNFVLSAILGRTLSLEQFGIFTLFSTLAYFVTIFINSLAGIVNYQVAHSFGQGKPRQSVDFFLRVRKSIVWISLIITLFWVVLAVPLAKFFNIPNVFYFLLFAPVFSLGLIGAAYRGYLQGNFEFGAIAALAVVESGSKLLLGSILVFAHLNAWIYSVIPISFLVVLFFAWIFSKKRIDADLSDKSTDEQKDFSWKYFLASILTGSSSAIFINMDVVLAKHYLTETLAGQYAILSLVGKLVFFTISLLSIFIVSLARRDEAQLVHPSKNFYKLLAGSVVLSVGIFVVFGNLRAIFVPLLLGKKSLAILPFVNEYILATIFYGLAGFISGYHIVRSQYFFSKVSIIFALAMIGAIMLMHGTISQIVQMFYIVSLGYFVAVIVLHLLSWIKEDLKKFRKSPSLDLVDILNISIGIPSYNEEKNIGNLLDALLNQETKNINIRKIVVISSGSTDQTNSVVENYMKKDTRIILLTESKRSGKAQAINKFLRVVSDAVVVIESADTIPKPDAIEKLCVPFLADPKVGMTGAAPLPVNSENTFIGYIVHAWWWFHRNIPRFGELVAFRNILPQISANTAVDEAYIQAKIIQAGFRAIHVDDAVVFNKGSLTVADLIKQRRRISNGHARLMSEENIKISNMTRSSLFLLFFKYEMTQFRHVIWLLAGIGLEIWARILGFFDKYFYSYNPVVWEVADSTKDLETEDLVSVNLKEDPNDSIS